MAHSSTFIRKQCKTEYQLFANKLRNKHLTIKQLVYLHNTVLLPNVEYRLMTTILSEEICNDISSPMRSVIKRSSGFSITLPSSFLHYERGIGRVPHESIRDTA